MIELTVVCCINPEVDFSVKGESARYLRRLLLKAVIYCGGPDEKVQR
jgi:hypothetical protein